MKFKDRANYFMSHADKMSNTAYLMAAAGGNASKHGVEAIQATCNQVKRYADGGSWQWQF